MKNRRFNPFTRSVLSGLTIAFCSILFYVLLINFKSVRAQLAVYFNILLPFVIGIVLAFLLARPINFFERKLFSRFRARRALSILTVYLLLFIVIVGIIAIIFPQIVSSFNMLWGLFDKAEEQLPVYVAKFHLDADLVQKVFGSWEDILTKAMKAVQSSVPQILSVGYSISSGFINTLMAVFASIYMLASKEKLVFQAKKVIYAIFPQKRAKFIVTLASQSNHVFSDFITGKLIDSAIIGVICFIGMLVIHRPYAVLISVIVGVTNIIPFFGPFIGAIPSAFVLLFVDPVKCLLFLVFILALQQFDGNYLGPRILGDSTGLSPLWVLFAITVGGGLFGFLGMLFGVPTFAVIYNLIGQLINSRLKNKNIDTAALAAAGGGTISKTEAAADENISAETDAAKENGSKTYDNNKIGASQPKDDGKAD